MRLSHVILVLILSLGVWSCGEDGVLLFSVDDDIMMGKEFDQQIESDPEFNILPESQYPEAYSYLYSMRDAILNSGQVKYVDEFSWEMHIIDDPQTLNAFATPGGYIYIYTGLINYLDDASSLAGVMGHEIAHSDERHSSKQLQKNVGVSVVLGILLGDDLQAIQNLTANLLALSFSRSDETDADNQSVEYLCETDFLADGAAFFFEKIEAEGGSTPPEFLSTHPSPDRRVENIREMADMRSCGTEIEDPTIENMSYAQFKALLPR